MALFTNLHHVGEVLVQMIADGLPAPPAGTIRVGPPLATIDAQSEDIRLTLLWVTPQPTHRSDRWERKADGGLLPPPLTLSAFYMITTYGSANGDPIRAHELLGNVMQIFHSSPQLQLPLESLPTAGEGPLSFVQVPTAAELVEKVYSPLQVQLRPWILFEVAPIQLAHQELPQKPPPVVSPGGIRFGDMQALERPQLLRVTPQQQARGGRVRVDLDLRARPLSALLVDGVATLADELIELVAEHGYVLNLPKAVAPGSRWIRVEVGDDEEAPPRQLSERVPLQVLDPSTPTLDAPSVASHSLADSLSMSGRSLLDMSELLFWPDRGLSDPSEVKSVLGFFATESTCDVTRSMAVMPGFSHKACSFLSRNTSNASASLR